MVFETKLAIRYLISSRLQTSLLVAAVAIGVLVFTFIAALINGLGVRLADDVTGNVAHVILEPEARVPRTYMTAARGRALFAVQPGHDDTEEIRTYRSVVEIAERMRGVRVAVPEVLGNATLARGTKSVAVTVTGVAPAQAATIAPIDRSIVRGRLDLGVGNVVVGSNLARDLAIDVGDRLVLRAARARPGAVASPDAIVTVRGIFTLGVQAVDERAIYLEITAARKLFGLSGGVSQIEIKVDDIWRANELRDGLARATGLKASSWLDRNARLQEGLRAQASTATMIKFFSLLTIAIGVASTLFLSVMRRRPEIGILRSFGIGRGAIVRTFVLQGVVIGVMGSLIGVVLGFAFGQLLLVVAVTAKGIPSIPIDPARGEYLNAMILATVASAIAAVIPAWSAAKTDPLEAIQS